MIILGGVFLQNNIIKAFRQRLFRAGFRDISIYNLRYGFYSVSCTSPTGESITRRMSLAEIEKSPRRVFFL